MKTLALADHRPSENRWSPVVTEESVLRDLMDQGEELWSALDAIVDEGRFRSDPLALERLRRARRMRPVDVPEDEKERVHRDKGKRNGHYGGRYRPVSWTPERLALVADVSVPITDVARRLRLSQATVSRKRSDLLWEASHETA